MHFTGLKGINTKTFLGAVICCFILTSITKAAVRLPAIIGSHMILQQNSNVKIWGWCESSENIVLTTT